jgi:hypothetical protein
MTMLHSQSCLTIRTHGAGHLGGLPAPTPRFLSGIHMPTAFEIVPHIGRDA